MNSNTSNPHSQLLRGRHAVQCLGGPAICLHQLSMVLKGSCRNSLAQQERFARPQKTQAFSSTWGGRAGAPGHQRQAGAPGQSGGRGGRGCSAPPYARLAAVRARWPGQRAARRPGGVCAGGHGPRGALAEAPGGTTRPARRCLALHCARAIARLGLVPWRHSTLQPEMQLNACCIPQTAFQQLWSTSFKSNLIEADIWKIAVDLSKQFFSSTSAPSEDGTSGASYGCYRAYEPHVAAADHSSQHFRRVHKRCRISRRGQL